MGTSLGARRSSSERDPDTSPETSPVPGPGRRRATLLRFALRDDRHPRTPRPGSATPRSTPRNGRVGSSACPTTTLLAEGSTRGRAAETTCATGTAENPLPTGSEPPSGTDTRSPRGTRPRCLGSSHPTSSGSAPGWADRGRGSRDRPSPRPPRATAPRRATGRRRPPRTPGIAPSHRCRSHKRHPHRSGPEPVSTARTCERPRPAPLALPPATRAEPPAGPGDSARVRCGWTRRCRYSRTTFLWSRNKSGGLLSSSHRSRVAPAGPERPPRRVVAPSPPPPVQPSREATAPSTGRRT